MRRNERSIPDGLTLRVVARIRREEHRRFRRKMLAFGIGSAAALGGTVFFGMRVFTLLSQSGFSQYFSLIFSDGPEMAMYWKELVLSLVESLPMLGIIVFLALLLASVWMAAGLIVNAQKFAHS
ncbi:MAG TPA: hypothetical protein VFM02_03555 [Candidatus Paceibacterota bacterium]|nr:hypothetical protein [Candidatus Paceibacterota bacterium]